MASFFEKLKKGMGIEAPLEEEGEEPTEELVEKPLKKKMVKRVKIEERPPLKQVLMRVKKPRKLGIAPKPIEEKIMEVEEEEPTPVTEVQMTYKEVEEAEKTPEKEKWFEAEGQLAVDVYQTATDLIIQSAIAGVEPENLEISMEKDVIMIKGTRQKPFEEEGDYFAQECFWGPFSREIILPVEIDPNRVMAQLKDGILTIRIPKILREKRRTIVVKGS